jgi:hypothetical protein
MQVYKRTRFSLIRGLVVAPFSGLVVFIIAQIFLPLPICIILGLAAAGGIVYIAVFSEDIYFELDDDGMFRYFCMGKIKNTIDLSKCRIGYHRKTEWGILGNNNIDLKLVDLSGEKMDIEAGPLGTVQFDEMFAAMEKYAIQDTEVLKA